MLEASLCKDATHHMRVTGVNCAPGNYGHIQAHDTDEERIDQLIYGDRMTLYTRSLVDAAFTFG